MSTTSDDEGSQDDHPQRYDVDDLEIVKTIGKSVPPDLHLCSDLSWAQFSQDFLNFFGDVSRVKNVFTRGDSEIIKVKVDFSTVV